MMLQVVVDTQWATACHLSGPGAHLYFVNITASKLDKLMPEIEAVVAKHRRYRDQQRRVKVQGASALQAGAREGKAGPAGDTMDCRTTGIATAAPVTASLNSDRRCTESLSNAGGAR
jgi:hypothetical protein